MDELRQDALASHLTRQLETSRRFFWNRLRWRLVVSQLPATAREVVDVGAGTGFLGEYLRERRPDLRYRFVEPLPSLEQSLSDRFGEEANARGEDFGGADAVALLDVLEHQEDDAAFLADLAVRMSPGSTLLLTVPAMPGLWSDWDSALGHFRRYTKRSLREATSGLPLEAREASYLFPEMIPPALLRRWRGAGTETPAAEFPVLPNWLNQSLFRLGSASLAARRLWVAGSSVFGRFVRVPGSA